VISVSATVAGTVAILAGGRPIWAVSEGRICGGSFTPDNYIIKHKTAGIAIRQPASGEPRQPGTGRPAYTGAGMRYAGILSATRPRGRVLRQVRSPGHGFPPPAAAPPAAADSNVSRPPLPI
jgi:hypothetical protein